MPANPYVETSTTETSIGTLYDDVAVSAAPCVSRGALLWSLSRAFDLSEGQEPGHAQRVAFIGCTVARDMGLSPADIEHVYFACLLHDAGMAAWPGPAMGQHAESKPGNPGLAWSTTLRMLSFHSERGAQLAERLGLGDAVADAIARHHDHWESITGPSAMISRITTAADSFESLLRRDGASLQMRREGRALVEDLTDSVIGPAVADILRKLTASDTFWLGFHDNDLAAAVEPAGFGPLLMGNDLMETLKVFSDVVDERNARPAGTGRMVAEMSHAVAMACMFTERRADMVKAAALMQDVGTLGVPASHLRKPDILTIDEMAQVQLHPTFARDILSEIPGFGAASWWVGCHHERVDGKGYPGMLSGREVPIEAQIIGMCEMYNALISERPFRPAMRPVEAAAVMFGNVDARFSADIFAIFEGVVGPF